MKTKFLIVLFTITSLLSYSQILTNDTVLIIIDTTKSYVTYSEGISKYDNKPAVGISIKCHYYDDSYMPDDKDFARMSLSQGGVLGNIKKSEKYRKLIVAKQGLDKRFIMADDEWIHKQNDLYVIKKKIGHFWSDKYNFVAFSQDYYNCSDSVLIHRVAICYNEIAY